jgi:phage shock protein PspC (stress-responsive transcriptional regulator)
MEDAGQRAHDRLMETVNDTPPPTDSVPPYKTPGNRLTRSTGDKVVGGLAGGLGRYFGIDPVVFRIAFVVLTLAGGSGILLYLVGWLMIPDDNGSAAVRFGSERNSKLVAAVLAGLGVLILLDNIAGGDDDVPVGLILIAGGALLLWSRRDKADGSGPPAPPAPPSPPTGDAGQALTPPDVSDSTVETVGVEAAPPPPPPPAEPKPRSALVPVTLSLLAVLAGGLSLVGVSATTGLALALLLTAGALIVGAWRGRARWLIPVGLVLSVALAAAAVVDDVPVRGGAGDVRFHAATIEDIRSPYRLGVGELVVDLGNLDLRGQTVTVVASVAAGRVEVVVPRDAAVDVDAHVGAGNLQLLGRYSDGFDVDRTVIESGGDGGGRIVLRARAGMGEVEVRRAFA